MYQQDVSGVAVINPNSELVGNISVSDLKDIGYSLTVFHTLYVPCRQFLARKIEGSSPETPLHLSLTFSQKGMEVPLVYVMKSTPLSAVMEKFKFHQIRRVYIVESPSNLRPLGVITHTDVLELFSALAAWICRISRLYHLPPLPTLFTSTMLVCYFNLRVRRPLAARIWFRSPTAA